MIGDIYAPNISMGLIRGSALFRYSLIGYRILDYKCVYCEDVFIGHIAASCCLSPFCAKTHIAVSTAVPKMQTQTSLMDWLLTAITLLIEAEVQECFVLDEGETSSTCLHYFAEIFLICNLIWWNAVSTEFVKKIMCEYCGIREHISGES